jgi:TPR repeat protein
LISEGSVKDRVEVLKWYRKAAEQGHSMAMRALTISDNYIVYICKLPL